MTATATRLPLPEASAFPAPLVALVCWTAFTFIGRGERRTKLPINPHTGKAASSIDPTTWGTFEQARAFAEPRGYGVELMIDPPLVLLDMDDCLDPATGELTPMAASIVAEVDTYWEVSVSGRGLKGIAYGTKPGGRCRRNGLQLEIYDHARPAALTGQRWPDSPLEINDCTEAIGHIYGVAFPQAPPAPPSRGPSTPTDEDDAAVLDWLHEHSPAFARLWPGPHGADPSADDLALCNILAWRTGDPRRVDELFQRSGLYRPKWDERRGEQTYGEKTVAKAFEGRTSFWTPPAPRPAPHVDESRSSSGYPDESPGPPPDVAALVVEVQALRLENADLRQRLAKAERFNRGLVNFDKNRAIKKQKPTVRAALFVYGSKVSRGDVDAEGWARTSRAELAEVGGVSVDAAGDHLKDIDQWGVGIEKRVVEEDYMVTDARGQTMPQKRPRLEIRVNGDVVDKLETLCVFSPPKEDGKATWGGKREPCPSCGATATITTVTCAGCGEVLGKTHQDGTMGDGSAPLGAEENSDKQTPNIPPTPVVVRPPATYPPGKVTYTTEAEEDEDDAGDDSYDLYECNWGGCTARLKYGQIFCDHHRDKPHVPPPAPLVAKRPAAPDAAPSLVMRAGTASETRPNPTPIKQEAPTCQGCGEAMTYIPMLSTWRCSPCGRRRIGLVAS